MCCENECVVMPPALLHAVTPLVADATREPSVVANGHKM